MKIPLCLKASGRGKGQKFAQSTLFLMLPCREETGGKALCLGLGEGKGMAVKLVAAVHKDSNRCMYTYVENAQK